MRYYFVSFLANVDKSVLGVEIGGDLEIKSMENREFINFIQTLEKLPFSALFHRPLFSRCLNQKEMRAYYVTREIEYDAHVDNKEKELFEAAGRFQRKYEAILDRAFDLMLLFKEGAVFTTDRYYIREENGSLSRSSLSSSKFVPYRPTYTLTADETESLNLFISTVDYPFKYPFLQLAFDNFVESYRADNLKLSFLSLMISLEALLSRDNIELAYSLRRNAAVLLGNSKSDSITVQKKVKSLYDLRSSLVHGDSKKGKKKSDIAEADVLELRAIVREAIKEILAMKMDKDALMDHLTEIGYGDRISRKYST